jgi:hypothetical protein
MAARLALPGHLLSTVRLALPGVCREQDGRYWSGYLCRQAIGIGYALGALSGKVNEARAASAAVGRVTNRHIELVGPAAAALNGRPNQVGGTAWRPRLRSLTGT